MKRPSRPRVGKRINPSGKKVYFIDFKDPFTGRRIKEVVGSVRADAEKRADRVYREHMAIYLGEPDAQITDISLRDLTEAFFRSKEHRLAESSINRYRVYVQHFLDFMNHYYPTITSVRQIKKIYLDEHLNDLLKNGMANKTVNSHLTFIKGLMNFAIDEEYLNVSPARKIKPYPEDRNSRRKESWTAEEVRKIISEIKPQWRDAHEFCVLTGIRKGELMNLTWNDVSLDELEPTITIQAKEATDRQKAWKPKTNEYRIIPLSPGAVKLIERQSHSEEHDYVFKTPGGKQLDRKKVYDELKRALRIVGLHGDMHKWRHTFTSLLAEKEGLKTVSDLLGHKTTDTTQQYVHSVPSHLRTAVNSLSKLTAVRWIIHLCLIVSAVVYFDWVLFFESLATLGIAGSHATHACR